jgi:ElaB/YqjD/DUF883 family membrane-anchored ribosome-binding protein
MQTNLSTTIPTPQRLETVTLTLSKTELERLLSDLESVADTNGTYTGAQTSLRSKARDALREMGGVL